MLDLHYTSEFSHQEADAEEELLFAKEESEQSQVQASWKILIVDDEDEVHKVTKLALKNFILEERNLIFLSAYSGEEAKQLIQAHPDIAIILLDVIMETDGAGLDVVKHVRKELNNQIVRIILRTGQPGQVPEKTVIINYDINDYRTKTELTGQKLFTTVVTALRSFSTLMKMFEFSRRLEKEIEQRSEVELALRASEAREREKAMQLEQSLHDLQQAQLQLVQTEKMSSLGQLVASVAHEITNPVNFIYGNLNHARQYINNLLNVLHLYEKEYPNPTPEIEAESAEIELEFLREDFAKVLSSMQVGVERIKDVVQSLRTFSHLDESEIKEVNIHSGIDSTLRLLENRLKAKAERPAINVVKEYGDLPKIECYPGLLNQVFMNILNTTIDVLDEHSRQHNSAVIDIHPVTLAIRTKVIDDYAVEIRIADNGPGIAEKVQHQLFDPFSTTKLVGRDTGLGLSLSYSIVTEKHGGSLRCVSAPGQGAEFVIQVPKSTHRLTSWQNPDSPTTN